MITEITLKVYGIPEAISSAVCQFETLEGAVDSVITTIHAGVPVARMELLDEVQMGACIDYSKLEGYQAKPTIFFEFHGSEAGVKEQAETVEAITADFGGSSFEWATRTEDRNVLWQRGTMPIMRDLRCGPAQRAGRLMFACLSRGWRNASGNEEGYRRIRTVRAAGRPCRRW